MRRWALLFLLVATACSGRAIADSEPVATTTNAATATSTTMPPTTVAPVPAAAPTTTTTSPPLWEPLVSWMPDGLPPDFGEIVRSVPGVINVTVIGTGTFHIVSSETSDGAVVDQPPDGFVIPVGGIVIDPATYRAFADNATAAVIAGLSSGELILSESSAALRRLGPGDRMVFEGGEVRSIAAVLPDAAVGGAEIIGVGDTTLAVPGSERGYALIDFDGTGEELEREILARLPQDALLRVRDPRDTSGNPGRSVRSQIFIKQEFGEFAYRPTGRGRFEIDPAWMEANIIDVEIPLLGKTVCHRKYAALLTEVMKDLDDHGLDGVIDPRAFRGCWNSRYISGSTRLSRHAWGAAADINFGNDLDGGPGSPVNEELLERMLAVGIRSGHLWTRPDPGHFEFYGSGA